MIKQTLLADLDSFGSGLSACSFSFSVGHFSLNSVNPPVLPICISAVSKEEAVEAAIPYFSALSMFTMVSVSHITNQNLIEHIKRIYRSSLSNLKKNDEAKEPPKTKTRSAPFGFFDLLPTNIQKDPSSLMGQQEGKSPIELGCFR